MTHLDLFLMQNKKKRSLTNSIIPGKTDYSQSAGRNKVALDTHVAKRIQHLSI